MRQIITIWIAIYFTVLAIPSLAQTNNLFTEEETIKPITIYQAQVSGVSENVVSIMYRENGRRVNDPVMITPETEIWLGKKQVGQKNIRTRQYLTVTAVREGDELIAQKIDIGYKPLPKKKVTIKPKPKTAPKVVTKPSPVRAATQQ